MPGLQEALGDRAATDAPPLGIARSVSHSVFVTDGLPPAALDRLVEAAGVGAGAYTPHAYIPPS
jgi:hypothetical protein